MASMAVDDFLGALAQGATGALTGKAQAVKDNADIEEQKQQQASKLALDRMKIQADQDAEVRKNAFTYAQELQKSLTPDNMAFMQQNGLLDQHQREINTAMGVVAGHIPTNRWQPQFAFEAPTEGAGGPLPMTPGAGGALAAPAPPAGPSGGPSPAAQTARAGGLIPALAGSLPGPPAAAASPFGPTPPQSPLAAPAPPPAAPVARRAFTPTVAQGITERTTAESEAAGKATREDAVAKQRLAEKEFNLKTALAQIDKTLAVANFRKDAGQAAFDGSSKIWTDLLRTTVEVLKETGGGPTDETAKALKSLLSVPNLLGGRAPNATAIRMFMQKSGVPPDAIEKVMSDPALAGSNTDLQTPAAMPGVGTGGEASRGAGGGPPVLPPAGPAASPQAIDQALRSRSVGLTNRAGGAPGTMGAARTAAAALGAVSLPGGARPIGPASGRPQATPIAGARPGEARVEPARLQGNPRAIQQIAQMAPEAKMAAQAGFKALADAGIPFTVNSTYRTAGQQAGLVAQKKAGKNPNPVAPVGKSTHQAGMALDLSSGTGKQEDLAAVLGPLGWKWAGPRDPVHFTFVGASQQGATGQASRAGGGAARTATAQPPAGGGTGSAPAGTDLTAAAKEIGVKTPAMAAPIANPYQPGTIGSEIFSKLAGGQRTVTELVNAYAHDPARQNLVQQIGEQIKRQQMGNQFGGIPTPSLEGARLPTQAGIDSLGGLMYTEPGVGTPNVTTEPIETSPNVGRQEVTVQDRARPDGGGGGTSDTSKAKTPDGKTTRLPEVKGKMPPFPSGKMDMGPFTQGGKKAAPTTSPATGASAKGAPAKAAPLDVPPPPSLMGVSRPTASGPAATGKARGRTSILDQLGTRNVLGVEPRAPTPEKVETVPRMAPTPEWAKTLPPNPFAAKGPKAGPLTPEEIRSERQALQPYLKSPYRAATDRWMKQNGLDDIRDRRFYYDLINTKFVPELQRRGIPQREIEAHLDHYLRAHQAWNVGKGGLSLTGQKAGSPTPAMVRAPTRGTTDIGMPPNPYGQR